MSEKRGSGTPEHISPCSSFPAEWRLALELLAKSANGCATSLLLAHGVTSALIAGLVDCGFATSATRRVLAGGRTVEVMRLQITDRGQVALER
jgi:hypothetical protein